MAARLMQAGGRIDTRQPVNWQHPLNRGAGVWCLPLPGRSGGGTLFDLAGRYPGTLSSGVTWTAGPDGFPAVAFGSGSQSVGFGTASPVAGGAATWTLTLKWSGTAGRAIGQWGNSSAQQAWLIEVLSDGAVQLAVSNLAATFKIVKSNTSITAGAWVRLGVTYDAGSVSMYFDGSPQGTTVTFGTYSGSVQAGSGPIDLNNETSSATAGGLTAATDLRMYPRALAAADLAALADQTRRGHPDTLRRYTPRAWLTASGSPPLAYTVPRITGFGW